MDFTQRGTALSVRFNPGETGPNRTFRVIDGSNSGYLDGFYTIVDGKTYTNLTFGRNTADSETISYGPNNHVIPGGIQVTSTRVSEVENSFLWVMDLVELRQLDAVNQGTR